MYKYRIEQENIITKDIELFCFFDESLKALGVKTPKNSLISYADVLLITYHAFKKYNGNYKAACVNYFYNRYSTYIDYSRFLKKLKIIQAYCVKFIMKLLEKNLAENNNKILLVDSMPIPLTQHKRKSKRLSNSDIVGFNAFDKTYYVGVKLTMLCTTTKKPVFLYIDYASNHDIKTFEKLVNLTSEKMEGTMIIGDKAYNSKELEAKLLSSGIILNPIRKNNIMDSERKQKISIRKNIETAFSMIKNYLTNTVRTRTFNGFIEKIQLAIAMFTLSQTFALKNSH